ncbi:membrane protein [Labrys miyagiensis]
MTRLLTQQDHDRIAAAITAAEARTSGEIYCIVAHSVATYRWIPVTLAAVAVLLTPLIVSLFAPDLHRWPVIGTDWSSGNLTGTDADAAVALGLRALSLLQIAIFAVVAMLAWPRRVRLWLAPPAMRRRKVLHAARSQFLAQGLEQTRDRTGLMLFIALAERQAVLIADEGIDSRVEQDVWDDTVAQLTKAAGAGHVVEGLAAAIDQCGDILARHFPPESLPVDQLPNRVVEL